MAEGHNVFLSWSGERSKEAAKALRDWLPVVLQAAKPWMSDDDIDKGSRGFDEIGRALEGIKIGIICLTPENVVNLWIHYEAGALSKTLDSKTRVCTYLLGDLQPQNIKPPLGMFQATRAQKEDTRKLVHAINRALGAPVTELNLDVAFDGQWLRLERRLEVLPVPEKPIKVTRPVEEMISEILELSRGAAQRDGLTIEALLQEREITYRNLLAAYLKLQDVQRERAALSSAKRPTPEAREAKEET